MTDPAASAASGVAHADALVALAEGVVGDDDALLARARTQVLEQLGPAGLEEAAAVASNFERMDRVADATGIPLDAPLEMMTEDLRADLDLGRYASAANTPPVSAAQRALGRVLRPLTLGGIRLALRVRDRFAGK